MTSGAAVPATITDGSIASTRNGLSALPQAASTAASAQGQARCPTVDKRIRRLAPMLHPSTSAGLALARAGALRYRRGMGLLHLLPLAVAAHASFGPMPSG